MSKFKASIQYYFNEGHIRGQIPVKSCTLEITIWVRIESVNFENTKNR